MNGNDRVRRGAGTECSFPTLLPTMSNHQAQIGAATTGQKVGRYEILKYIASGGMGAVYQALDPTLDRIVALKVLSPEAAARETQVNRFRREAKMAARLQHENIVQIYEFGEANGTYFLALEFVDGMDLQDYIEKQSGERLDIDEALNLLIQATKALDQMHAVGIVHRDVKPSNFLLATSKSGKLIVKLADLGLARSDNDDARLTRDNTTLGTVDYISPEQARDSASADIRSDLYSLGCTFYVMLTGHGPFPKGNLIERIQHHLNTPAPDVRNIRSETPARLATILSRLLEKSPDDRYSTPLHLLHELETPERFQQYLDETRKFDRPAFKAETERGSRADTQLLRAMPIAPPPPTEEGSILQWTPSSEPEPEPESEQAESTESEEKAKRRKKKKKKPDTDAVGSETVPIPAKAVPKTEKAAPKPKSATKIPKPEESPFALPVSEIARKPRPRSSSGEKSATFHAVIAGILAGVLFAVVFGGCMLLKRAPGTTIKKAN